MIDEHKKLIAAMENKTVRKWCEGYLDDSRKRPGDEVEQLIPNLEAKYVVAWLVIYKGLSVDCAENVESNLRNSLKASRLQGRIDRVPWIAVLAELWGLRFAVKRLREPEKVEEPNEAN